MSKIINKIKLNRLYSEPMIFDPIVFDSGLNLIVGERGVGNDKQSQKTNSVGKSLCVDFIRFALLKKYEKTRISLIPNNKINKDAYVCLDFNIGNTNLIIKRQLNKSNKIILISDNNVSEVSETTIKKYLESLLFCNESLGQTPSFRNLINCVTREESSNFSDIFRYFDPKDTNTIDFENILYFLNINIEDYNLLKQTKQSLDQTKSLLSEYKIKLETRTNKKIKEIKSEIFNKRNELKQLEEAFNSYKTDNIYQNIEDEISEKENEIEKLRITRNKIKYEINAIESMPEIKKINLDELTKTYNLFKKELGNFIKNSLEKTIVFKDKIEKFQKDLLEDELKKLKKDLCLIQEKIDVVSENLNIVYNNLNAKGALKDLKCSIQTIESKKDKLKELESLYEKYEEQEDSLDNTQIKLQQNYINLKQDIKNNENRIESLLNTITTIHEIIMGTKDDCSFSLFLKENSKGKEVLDYNYRIKDDGGHSVDKEKVFIFDVSLMFDEYSKNRHPQFLVHDGIFEVDKDTLLQSLNFMYHKSKYNDFQYIVAINKDKLEGENFDFKLNDVIKASFTKARKFLKCNYQELNKNTRKED